MCILLDRAVDTVTPMCLQLTYEGLVDETLGITNGIVTLDPSGAVHAPAGLSCVAILMLSPSAALTVHLKMVGPLQRSRNLQNAPLEPDPTGVVTWPAWQVQAPNCVSLDSPLDAAWVRRQARARGAQLLRRHLQGAAGHQL